MKVIRNIVIICIVATSLGILLRGVIFRSVITYQAQAARNGSVINDQALVARLDRESIFTVKDVIDRGQRITAEYLEFTTGTCMVDPNQLTRTRQAHCVGYAAFCSAVCNHLLEQSGLASEWTASAWAGKLYMGKKDIHQWFDSPFYKDHDFVVLQNPVTGQRLAIDPVLYDYLHIASVDVK